MTAERRLEALFAVIRAEARRNRRFACELDRALGVARPRRPRLGTPVGPEALEPEPPSTQVARLAVVHPVAMLRRDGPSALRDALGVFDAVALRELLQEHNLDPSGAGEQEEGEALVERIVRAAEKRLERDQKLFAY